MRVHRSLSAALVDEPMLHYFRCKFASLSDDELALRIEETLRFLFISHECTGAIPVSKEIDEIWHAWILQTQEYIELCERLPTGRYIHHSANDYLSYFDPLVGEHEDLEQEVKMLALYVANFGPFDEGRGTHWLLARHLLQRCGWSVSELNGWLSEAGSLARRPRTVDAPEESRVRAAALA
jgi:hypothetical protein